LLRRLKIAPARSRRFREDEHDRFRWHKLHATDYGPSIDASCVAEFVYSDGCGLGILQRVA
jgi:hypothetical protein